MATTGTAGAVGAPSRASTSVTVADVYGALLSLGAADIQNLATTLSTDDLNGVLASIEELAQVGLVRPYPAYPDGWTAQAPAAALAGSLKAIRQRLLGEVTFIESVTQRAVDVALTSDQFLHRSLGQETERLHGAAGILREIATLTASAKLSVDSLLPHVPSAESLAASIVDDGQALDRGVRIRSIFPHDGGALELLHDYATGARQRGAGVRTSSLTPARMLVIDQAVAVVITGSLSPDPTALVIRDPAVVDALAALFLMLWDQAADFPGEPHELTLTPSEAAVIRSMMLGQTDETIARALEVTDRTVRRIVGTLMRRTGAESRFALGAAAARRGWV